jgi:cell division transport system permease protein
MSSVAGIKDAIGEPRGDPQPMRGRGFFPRFGGAPLLPEAGAGGAPLTAVIAVISSLASLALAAFLLIAAAAGEWTSELKSSVTVQVKGVDAAQIEDRLAAARELLAAEPAVEEFEVIAPAEAARLLEPWLGKGNTGSLNVPALIELHLTRDGRRAVDDLAEKLERIAPGVALDDHGGWNERLANAARSGQALAFAVFALVMGAACAISVFAARAGLSANAEVVSLLHIVGATDVFIANEVQRRFTVIGLRGALIGLVTALFLLTLFALALRARGADGFFVPGVELGPAFAAPLLAVPIAICLVTAVAARLTVLRTLSETY